MYYYLILVLQAYCAYHAYKNKNDYYWYFAIIFIPLIGCLVYLFVNVFRRQDVDKVQADLISALNPTKKIKDLEKKLKFAATFENQVALADAYLDAGHFERAIEDYQACLKEVFQNDLYAVSKLVDAYYFSSKFEEAVACAERIMDNLKFKKSRAAFLYALALEKVGRAGDAEAHLRTFDAPFSRYQERLELAKFFNRIGKPHESREVLQEILAESEGMSKQSLRQNRLLIHKAKELLSTSA